MLMNNLDPEVAERPDDLVVYGGTGRAARSWDAFDAIVRELRALADDETLLVQSGKPVGVFRTHEWSPRVLIANSNLVGEWANWDEFRRLEALGPDDVRADDRGLVDLHRQPGHRPGDLRVLRRDRAPPLRRLARRDDHAHRRARRDGRRAAARGDDERRRRALHRGRSRADRAAGSRPATSTSRPTTSTTRSRRCEAAKARAARAQRRPLRRTPPRSFPSCSRRGFEADVVTDQTSAHDPLVGYIPAGLSLDGGRRSCASRDPDEYIRRARASARRALLRDGRLQGRGRRGLRLRQQPPPRGRARRLRARLRLPRLRPRLHPAAVLRGQGPVPLGGALRRPGRHRGDRPRRARRVRRRRGARHRWIRMAGERIAFQGLPARICWLGYGERRRLGLRFNEMVAQRRGQRPDRDRPRPPRLRLGRLALPRDRGDARRLRRDRRLAAAERARQHRLRAPPGCRIHHGGGVGIGRSIHAGMVCVADGTAARRREARPRAHRRSRAWASSATPTPATSARSRSPRERGVDDCRWRRRRATRDRSA